MDEARTKKQRQKFNQDKIDYISYAYSEEEKQLYRGF